MLKFSPMKHNAKLATLAGKGKGYTFSLPAGHTCPFASQCLSRADRTTGKISDGEATEFRCFAASMENRFPNLRAANWHNFEVLRTAKTAKGMADTILASLPANATLVRVHVAGDFFSPAYFAAWMMVAQARPYLKFYAYTKSLRYWKEWRAKNGMTPDNFVLTASAGGKDDHLIKSEGFRSAQVVFTEDEADRLGLEIDHDDSHAAKPGPSFALLLHGAQPKGSEAGKAWHKLKTQGKAGYSR